MTVATWPVRTSETPTQAVHRYAEQLDRAYARLCAWHGTSSEADLTYGRLAHDIPARAWAAIVVATAQLGHPHPASSGHSIDELIGRIVLAVHGNTRHRALVIYTVLGGCVGQLGTDLARHPDTTDRILHALCGSPEPEVRRYIAARPAGASRPVLTTLAADPDPHVRAKVAWRPAYAAAFGNDFAADPDPLVRLVIASASTAPDSAIRALIDDPDPRVRDTARDTARERAILPGRP